MRAYQGDAMPMSGVPLKGKPQSIRVTTSDAIAGKYSRRRWDLQYRMDLACFYALLRVKTILLTALSISSSSSRISARPVLISSANWDRLRFRVLPPFRFVNIYISVTLFIQRSFS